jgi:hypothetical protein
MRPGGVLVRTLSIDPSVIDRGTCFTPTEASIAMMCGAGNGTNGPAATVR